MDESTFDVVRYKSYLLRVELRLSGAVSCIVVASLGYLGAPWVETVASSCHTKWLHKS